MSEVKLTIPDGVSMHLIQKLDHYQRQISTLVRNHNILTFRAREEPQDHRIKDQIKMVERMLVHFDKEQRPIITQIRGEIKQQEKSAELSPKSSCEGDSSGCLVQRPEKSIKDRMAIVRAMRKRKRKHGGVPRCKSGTQSRSSTPSPKCADEQDEMARWEKQLIDNQQHNGYVFHVDKKVYHDQPRNEGLAERHPAEVQQTVLGQCDQTEFLLNLGLTQPQLFSRILEYHHSLKEASFAYRNLTYIPDLCDKKQRPNYNYLSADLHSPPLLRTRKRRPAFVWAPAAKVSRYPSRCSTPEVGEQRHQPSSTPCSASHGAPSPASSTSSLLPPHSCSLALPTQSAPSTSECPADQAPEEKPCQPDEQTKLGPLHGTRSKAQGRLNKSNQGSAKLDGEREKLLKRLSTLECRAEQLDKLLNRDSATRTISTRKERLRRSELETELLAVQKESEATKKKVQAMGPHQK